VSLLSRSAQSKCFASPGNPRSYVVSDELELAALPTAVGLTRLFFGAYLRKWCLESVTETVEQVASEIITNAVQATGLGAQPAHDAAISRIIARLRWQGSSVVIEAWDREPRPPVLSAPRDLDEGGRGLILVTALTTAWGYHRSGSGKVVWAEVAIPGVIPPPQFGAVAVNGRETGQARVLAGVDWSRWSVVLLKPDCLERGLVAPVLARVVAHALIVATQAVTVSTDQIFAHYEDMLLAPQQYAPVDVPADLQRRYVGSKVVIALAHGPRRPDTATLLRSLLGHYDPAQASHDSIRGHFGTDSLMIARSQNRLIDNLIHTSDDPDAARRDFLIWFGSDRAHLLHPTPRPEDQP
jgi:nucleoside-diphosphate kinase